MTSAEMRAADDSGGRTGGKPGVPKLRLFAGRRWEAADTVVTLAAALIVIIFGIFAFLCVQGYSTTIASARTRAETAANIVAEQATWMMGASLSMLAVTDARLALLPAAIDVHDKAELDSAFASLPAGAKLGLYDAQGVAVPNGGTPSLPVDISATPYYAAIAQGGDWTVGAQDKDAATGEPIIVIAKRLGGEVFSGVAVLAIGGDIVRRFGEPLKLGTNSTISLIRSDGWVIARSPPLAEPMNLAGLPSMDKLNATESGSFLSERSPVDGIARVIGFKHVAGLPLIAQASVAFDTVVTALWTSIIIVLWLLLPIAAALMGGSLWTAYLLRKSTRQQASLATALAHNETLFREIHHRVKNNLQSVASLLQMQPIPREIKANMGQRIAAMSAVHEHIYRSNNFTTVDVKGYLQTLIESIRAGQDPKVEVVEQFDDLAVDKDAATPLGLILNEVVSNAFKHAFPDGRDGVLKVLMTRVADGRGQLTVEDNGVGFDPTQPAKGIGRRLIGALTQQIGGESSFETAPGGGSLFTLTFPLASPGTAP